MKRSILLAVLLLPLLFSGRAQAQAKPKMPSFASVEARLQAALEEKAYPSLAVGIVHGDELIFAKAYGWANRKAARKAAPETLYRVGSVTKVFTACLAVMLRDEGKLRLDDPLADFLPGTVPVPSDARGDPEITLRHLLTHSSGLPRMPVAMKRATAEQPFGALTREELVQGLRRTKLDRPVGAAYAYSNLGFALLGLALEKAGEADYEELLQKRLLAALGMKRSGVDLPPALAKALATPYSQADTQKVVPDWKLGAAAPAGGLAADIRDMARFISWQFQAGSAEGKVLRGASLAEMHRPQRLTGSWRGATGLAWHVSPRPEGGDLVWHNGGMEGFRSWLGFVVEARVGVVVLTNCGKPVDALGRWLLEEAADRIGGPPPREPEKKVLAVGKLFLERMDADDELIQLFHPGFLKAIPPEKIKAMCAGLLRTHGPCRVESASAGRPPRSMKARLTCEKGKPLAMKIQLEPGEKARIVYLLLQ